MRNRWEANSASRKFEELRSGFEKEGEWVEDRQRCRERRESECSIRQVLRRHTVIF